MFGVDSFGLGLPGLLGGAGGIDLGLENKYPGLPNGVGPANYSEPLNNSLGWLNNLPGSSVSETYAKANAARGQQQAFLDALNARAMGGGAPSPAQLQQQMAFQQALKQSRGLAASQKGINPAIASRAAAAQSAGLTSQAAQQAALLRAQEQLQAQQLYGQQLGTLRQQDLASAQGMLGAESQQRALINQQVLGLGGLQNQQQALGAGIAQQNVGFRQGLVGGVIGSLGNIGAMAAGAWQGGKVKGYDDGGIVQPDLGPMHTAAEFINALGKENTREKIQNAATIKTPGHKKDKEDIGSSESGYNPTQVAGGMGGMPAPALVMEEGGIVPGRAVESGDSPSNDRVPAMLSPGEVVIPRSIAKDPEQVADFVRALNKKKSSKGYGEVIQAKKKANKED